MSIKKPKHVNIIQDITRTTIVSQTYDLILIRNVLEHIPNDRAVIAEMYRILKPGGKALVSVPIHPHMSPVTFEDPHMDRKKYKEVHGNEDHVRSCGLDYYVRFEEVGFRTETLMVKDLPELNRKRLCLSEYHVVWLFVK